MNASVFADDTDCNQDDDNDDYEIIDWDPEISNHEEFFTQDTNYGSEKSFVIMNNQPSRSQRDLLNTVKNYETPDPGRIRVMQNAESDIKSDYLTDPNAATSSSSSGDEWYLDREVIEDTALPSKSSKTLQKCTFDSS